MGVDAVEVAKAFEARLEKPSRRMSSGKFESASGTGSLMRSHTRATTRRSQSIGLLKAGGSRKLDAHGRHRDRSQKTWSTPAGVVKDARHRCQRVELFLPPSQRSAHSARRSYQPWQPYGWGWTRWLLEQYEFP